MSIGSRTEFYYVCQCDNCKTIAEVKRTADIYNAAQAARSLNWSFGKDKKVLCKRCRMNNYSDNYKWF